MDTTISGMGRGAGNTPTELIAQYMVSKLGYNYDIDAILDIIDGYMKNIRTKCTWGYSTPYFIAGSYGAHVNNISYLKQKNSIASKDMRFILNKIGAKQRKRYDYALLEKTYTDYLKSDIDDSDSINDLKTYLGGKNIVIIAPGASSQNAEEILDYIQKKNAVVISINFIPEMICCEYLYINNVMRYNKLKNTEEFKAIKKIFTSNISCEEQAFKIKFSRLIKCGWIYMDNSMLMLLRLLDCLEVNSVGIAGFDGYENNFNNYIMREMEMWREETPQKINDEIREMLLDFLATREHDFEICCITESRFQSVFMDKLRKDK